MPRRQSSPRFVALPKRFGSETPRIFTPPLRELTRATSKGFECIEFAESILELDLLPWQKWLLIHALELLGDGTYRFRTIVLLVARQNGKTTLMQVLSLWRMYADGAPLVIGTAQNLDIAEEQWAGAVELAESVPVLAELIDHVDRTNGKKALRLTTKERYKVSTASRRGSRGLTGWLILLDELREHQSWDAWAAVTKTTMAISLAQIWAASNAGDATSIVLRYLRKLAHAALGDPDGINKDITALDVAPDEEIDELIEDEDSLGIFEWSAAPGCVISDRDGWAQANPSMGYMITEKAIVAAARTDPEWVFRTEVLCQWSEGTLDGPFPTGVWESPANLPDGSLDPNGGCLDNESRRRKKSPLAVGIDTSWDRSTTYVAWAAFRKDGLIHVQVQARRAGTDWAIPYVAERVKKMGITAVAFQANGAPVSSLKDEAEAADIPLVLWQGADLARWTGLFYDRVRTRGIRHTSQPVLDVAAAVAAMKPSGDSWIWDRKHSPADIASLVAATAAVGALLNDEPEFESAYADDDAELLVL